jgi:hypothetical protein
MDDDVGEGLRHEGGALTGLGRVLRTIYLGLLDLGLRSWDSLQPKLSHNGLSALMRERTIDLGLLDLGLRSWDSLQPKLSHDGLSALRSEGMVDLGLRSPGSLQPKLSHDGLSALRSCE